MPSQTEKKQAKSRICQVYQPKVMNKHFKEVPKLHRVLAFIQDVLECGEHSDKIVWTNRDKLEFTFTAPHKFAAVYAKWLESPKMKFDTMCRSLRLYKKQGVVSKVDGKASTWRINEDRMKEMEQLLKNSVIPMSWERLPEFIKEILFSNETSN